LFSLFFPLTAEKPGKEDGDEGGVGGLEGPARAHYGSARSY